MLVPQSLIIIIIIIIISCQQFLPFTDRGSGHEFIQFLCWARGSQFLL